MSRNIEELTSELIRLSKNERLEIARFLLFLDRSRSDVGDVESAWEREITDRVKAIEEGNAKGIDYDEAVNELRSRFTQ